MWRFVIIDFCWEIDRQIETDLFPLLDLTEIGSVSILRKSPSLSWEPAIQHIWRTSTSVRSIRGPAMFWSHFRNCFRWFLIRFSSKGETTLQQKKSTRRRLQAVGRSFIFRRFRKLPRSLHFCPPRPTPSPNPRSTEIEADNFGVREKMTNSPSSSPPPPRSG